LPYVPNLRAARAIIGPVLKRLDMTWEEIIRDDRHRPYVLARREVYYALRQAGWSYPSIGQLCERDHSSILYAVQKWTEHLTKQATGD
jgi:chromosomal replication initiation ATPase DnaA